jgi:hypothetical protein
MRALLFIVLIFFVSGQVGCLLRLPSRYNWQAFQLENGQLVSLNCQVDSKPGGGLLGWDYSEAYELTYIILARDFKNLGIEVESIEILNAVMNQGSFASVLVAIGTKEFTEEWKIKGGQAAGYMTAQMRMQNEGPSIVKRGNVPSSKR